MLPGVFSVRPDPILVWSDKELIKFWCCFKKTIIPVPRKAHATCFNDYRPVALASIIMKCFERLVMAHINSSLPARLDPLQFAHRPNGSTADAVSLALHSSLKHLDSKDIYVRLQLNNYSFTFNTIIPSKLISKLRDPRPGDRAEYGGRHQGEVARSTGLKVDKSPGPDGLTPRVLKEIAEEVVEVLLVIFQESLESGRVPEDWKIANMTPLFLKGVRQKTENYRPMRLTSAM
eukprot:g35484.t1